MVPSDGAVGCVLSIRLPFMWTFPLPLLGRSGHPACFTGACLQGAPRCPRVPFPRASLCGTRAWPNDYPRHNIYSNWGRGLIPYGCNTHPIIQLPSGKLLEAPAVTLALVVADLQPRRADLMVGSNPTLSRAKSGEQSEQLRLGNNIFRLKQGVTVIKSIWGAVWKVANVH